MHYRLIKFDVNIKVSRIFFYPNPFSVPEYVRIRSRKEMIVSKIDLVNSKKSLKSLIDRIFDGNKETQIY